VIRPSQAGTTSAAPEARRRRAARFQVAALAIATVAAIAGGAVHIAWGDVPAAVSLLWGGEAASPNAGVLAWVRLPRVALAGAVGATLGVCGAAMQGLFRNPLADPALLGLSSGGALGVVLATVMADAVWPGAVASLGRALMPASAFLGALLSAIVVHRLSLREGRTAIATMMLAGVGLNAMTGALTGFLLVLASDTQLRSVTFWSLGSLAGASWPGVAVALPLLAVSCLALQRTAVDLDALNLGEAEAMHLGVNVESVTRRVLTAVALGVAAAVSVAGTIGFVGLAAPHVSRLWWGSDHRLVLGSSLRIGATLLIVADLGARALAAPIEIPIGVLTALAGAPLLLWLLHRDPRRSAR